MQVNVDGKVRIINIDQQQVIESYLRSLDVKPAFNILSPMSGKYHILTDPTPLEGDEINRYQSIIGTLNYYSSVTRYDIAYPVARLAQFSNKPTRGAMKGVNKMLQYILSTQDFKISGVYAPKANTFDYYSDSDHAGDMPITTSVSGAPGGQGDHAISALDCLARSSREPISHDSRPPNVSCTP